MRAGLGTKRHLKRHWDGVLIYGLGDLETWSMQVQNLAYLILTNPLAPALKCAYYAAMHYALYA